MLGRVLGPTKGAGNDMFQWILKANSNVLPRRSSQPLKVDEVYSTTELNKRAIFYGLIQSIWGISIKPQKQTDAENLDSKKFKEYEDKHYPKRTAPNIDDTVGANGKLLNQHLEYGKILHPEVSIQMIESMNVWRVTNCALGPDGTVAGTYVENLCLNKMIYEV